VPDGSVGHRGWRQGSSGIEERTDRLWSGSLNRAHAPSRAKRPGGSERDSFGDCRSLARTLLNVDVA
jgi:hypothetical protein